MVTREVVVLVCDLCNAEGDTVKTHEVEFDGKRVQIELCGKDLTRIEKPLLPVISAGRKVKINRRG